MNKKLNIHTNDIEYRTQITKRISLRSSKNMYKFNGKYDQPIRDEYREESISALSSAIIATEPLD